MCTHSSDTLIFCSATVNYLVHQFSAYGDKLLISKLIISKTFQKLQLIRAHCPADMSTYSQKAHTWNQLFVLVKCRWNLAQMFCITIKLHPRMQSAYCKKRCSQCTANGISCVGSVWHCYRISTANLNTHLMHSKIQNLFCNSIWTSIHKTKWNKYTDF